MTKALKVSDKEKKSVKEALEDKKAKAFDQQQSNFVATTSTSQYFKSLVKEKTTSKVLLKKIQERRAAFLELVKKISPAASRGFLDVLFDSMDPEDALHLLLGKYYGAGLYGRELRQALRRLPSTDSDFNIVDKVLDDLPDLEDFKSRDSINRFTRILLDDLDMLKKDLKANLFKKRFNKSLLNRFRDELLAIMMNHLKLLPDHLVNKCYEYVYFKFSHEYPKDEEQRMGYFYARDREIVFTSYDFDKIRSHFVVYHEVAHALYKKYEGEEVTEQYWPEVFNSSKNTNIPGDWIESIFKKKSGEWSDEAFGDIPENLRESVFKKITDDDDDLKNLKEVHDKYDSPGLKTIYACVYPKNKKNPNKHILERLVIDGFIYHLIEHKKVFNFYKMDPKVRELLKHEPFKSDYDNYAFTSPEEWYCECFCAYNWRVSQNYKKTLDMAYDPNKLDSDRQLSKELWRIASHFDKIYAE